MKVIGEKINATRKSIRNAIASKDRDTIAKQINDQVEASAHYIDLNAGNPDGDIASEADDMRWLIDIALEVTDKTLVLDSASADVIRAGADHLAGQRAWMLNSVKNESNVLESLLPIAAQHDAPVIALAMDEDSIPETTDKRLDNCRSIREKANALGVKDEHLYFDPLVMPISSNYKFGEVVLNTIRAIKQEFPEAKTTLGLSNVSYGLPLRQKINSAFLIAAVANGLDCAFCDPTRREIQQAVLLASLVCGKDRFCRRFGRGVRNGLFENGQQK